MDFLSIVRSTKLNLILILMNLLKQIQGLEPGENYIGTELLLLEVIPEKRNCI